MPGGLDIDATLGTSASVGRYFALVSSIPSVLLAVWIYLLLASGAMTGPPRLDVLARNNPIARPGLGISVVIAALAIAVVSHPIQFILVQCLEGYWGFSRAGRAARGWRTVSHLNRREEARQVIRATRKARRQLAVAGLPAEEYLAGENLRSHPELARKAVDLIVGRAAAYELFDSYPEQDALVMPTRLGNVLRRSEMIAGSAIGLPILKYASHIGMVADPAHTAYVQDQRSQLDLAVRMTATGIIAAGLTAVLLWADGFWLLLALIPYAVAWISYRGALASANSYGLALIAWVNLNRFRLYDALHLREVDNASSERRQNESLGDLIAGLTEYEANYSTRQPQE